MPRKLFTSDYQSPNRGRKKGSTPTDWLRRLSHTKVNFHNPITGKKDKAEVNLVVALQLILKATQDSDLPSIKEFFDRIDGKVKDEIMYSGEVKIMETIKIDNQELELKIGK